MTGDGNAEQGTSLLIGLVTHSGSERLEIGIASAREICDQLRRAGLDAELRINQFDKYSVEELDLTQGFLRRSRRDMRRVRTRWEWYLRADSGLVLRFLSAAAVSVKSLLSGTLLPGTFAKTRPKMTRSHSRPTAREAVRLLNIEASHLELIRFQVAGDFPWLLVLEDDAQPESISDTVDGLKALIAEAALCPQGAPRFVDLSLSFTLKELRASNLFRESRDNSWKGGSPRRIMIASRPVTNTVSAVLMSKGYSQALLETIDEFPRGTSVPIDWKINQGLLRLFSRGEIGSDDCWHVVPGPLIQASLLDSRREEP